MRCLPTSDFVVIGDDKSDWRMAAGYFWLAAECGLLAGIRNMNRVSASFDEAVNVPSCTRAIF